MTRFYPPITEDTIWALQVILENLETDLDYLGQECPYPIEFQELLRSKSRPVKAISQDLEEIDLEEEAHNLFLELRESKDHLTVEDSAERMSYFRVATSLLEKLIGMRERANNVKKVSAFYSAVLSVMEELLEPDQITKIRERLNDFC